eukprot:6205370-Pleurochrysis_carterae.AAC.3
MPPDGLSLHDAHLDGYGYNSAQQSLMSLIITPEYEPPAFDYPNGLCYIPPRMASMVYGHGVLGRYYWGISVYGLLCNATYFAVRTPLSTFCNIRFFFQSISTTKIRFVHLIRPTLERVGQIRCMGCWYSLTAASTRISVRSCFIALGASEIRNNLIIVPTIRPLLADESTPGMTYLGACQETPQQYSPLAV